jgi:hypothetical protein
MANIDFQAAAEQARDTGFRSKVQTAICATGMSIANNGSSTPARVALARSAVASSAATAELWALPVRVSGGNITKATLIDDDITAGVEGVFAALASN